MLQELKQIISSAEAGLKETTDSLLKIHFRAIKIYAEACLKEFNTEAESDSLVKLGEEAEDWLEAEGINPTTEIHKI